MLLDLCGPVSVADGAVSARFQADATAKPHDASGEVAYPAFLLAEAFAQIACRAAQAIAPLASRRYLPATTRGLSIVVPLADWSDGCRLVAAPSRLRPLPEFACRLIDRHNATLARANVTVAAAPGAAR